MAEYQLFPVYVQETILSPKRMGVCVCVSVDVGKIV